MRRTLTILLLLLVFVGCRTDISDEPPSSTAPEYLTLPFDTTQVINSLDITEMVDRQNLIDQETKRGLKDNLDTLELMYIAYACDCQKWVDPIEYNRVYDHNYGDRDNPGDDYIEFDLNTFGFYIEPAVEELEIMDEVHVSGNIVRFIGREFEEIGHPENSNFIMPAPEGKVFRYYSYEVQKPFQVWGPPVFCEIDEDTGDTLFISAKLTQKKN